MNLAQKTKLRSCYVKPNNGVAFFDSITIEADSITDIRQNSVFPVMEEKQIYVCRQMRSRLEAADAPLFLDVGTGSGVYAIYAAVVCNCRVIAIETSARALRIARQNALANGAVLCDRPQDVEAGSICFIQIEFGEHFIEEMMQQPKFRFDAQSAFDYVLLSPANMLNGPTVSTISIANHAFGGTDGQQPFLRQIQHVPSILKQGGYCLGTQMTPVVEDSFPQAIKDIAATFNGECHITVKKVFDKNLPTRTLLEGQYRSFLTYLEEDHDMVGRINAYIAEMANQHPQMTQVYYEACKGKKAAEEETYTFVPFDAENKSHNRDWKDRIYVYRNIVDYSAPKGYFPTPSVFTQDFAGNLLSARNLYENKRRKKADKPVVKTPLDLLDSRLKRHAVQQGNKFLFDVLLIEVVPIFTTQNVEKNIDQDCKVWIFDRNQEESVSADIQKTGKLILDAWQTHTKSQQEAGMGTFFHPSFIGTVSPDQWGQVCHSTLSVDTDITFDKENFKKVSKYRKRLEKYYRQSNQTQYKATDDQKDDAVPSGSSPVFTIDDSVSLNDLGVPSFKEYCEKLIDIDQIQDRMPAVAQNEQLLQQIRSGKQDLIDFFTGVTPLENNRHEWNEVLSEDVQLCHQAWHKYITKQFRQIAQESNASSQCGFSSLISFPLFIQNASGSTDSSQTLLESYRGGVWIYAASSDAWTIKHEQYLYDLAKLLLLLCVEQYALVAPGKFGNEREEYRSKLLGHEVKHVASAMSKDWVRPIQDFFDVVPFYGKKPDSSKIGRIEIWDKQFLAEPWLDNLGVTPFRSLIGSAGRLINFWCLLDNPADVPFSEDAPPTGLEQFIQECWDWAVDTVTMHALSRENPDTAARAVEIQKIRGAIKLIHQLPDLSLADANFPRITWDVTAASSSQTVWLCRLMVALFTNCVKHSNPIEPVKIALRCLSKQDSLYQIEIHDYASLGRGNNQLIKDRLIEQAPHYEAIAEEACAFLDKAKYKLEYLDNKLNLSTKEVIQTCLENLEKGSKRTLEDVKWPDRNIQPGDLYYVAIDFRYLEG
ncbi:MAG: 50S ribosomal protein L11 methyltransferase [Cyanobacteria bacterium J06560_6]